MNRFRLILFVAVCYLWTDGFCADSLRVQNIRHGFFRYSAATQSLLADMHPRFLRFDIAMATNHSEYDYGQTRRAFRPAFFGNVAANIPIFYIDQMANNRRYGLAVTFPIQVQIWLDLLEPTTAPIVDTDYRILLPIWTFIHRFEHRFVHNYTICLEPFVHESTHLGDELALQHRAHGLPIERENVSANWWEVLLTLNAEEDRLRQNHCFRLGFMMLWNVHSGWYFIDEREGDASLSRVRRSPWETYVQYQYQSNACRGFQAVASAEIRNRVLMGYPAFDWHDNGQVDYHIQQQGRVWTYNMFAGFRYNNPRYAGIGSRFSAGVRIYHGNNPYGQFRNQKGYNQFSLCLIVE